MRISSREQDCRADEFARGVGMRRVSRAQQLL